MSRSTRLICGAALLACVALAAAAAKDQSVQQQQQPQQPQQQVSLAARLLPQSKARSSRSLSDMFEKVKSRIFGSKKSSTSTGQPVAVVPSSQSSLVQAASAQRQPWDMNSALQQQYNPYSALATSGNSQYQWPVNTAAGASQYQPFSAATAPFSSSASLAGLDVMSAQASMNGQPSIVSAPASNAPISAGAQPSGDSSGGLFSSASHLIAQYLSPSSSGSSSAQPAQQQAAQSSLTPQQQQAQNQYQEFASFLDSMVAQTTGNQPGQQQQQRPPQFGQQQQPQATGFQQAAGAQPGDQDMSSSSQIQSYISAAGGSQVPSASSGVIATPQQASQKSSMVGLAEQLAPGAQFNKLISFPFSLSSNDDANKEGRYKLHIPFLNQHVKRSDSAANTQSGQQLAQQRAAQQQQLQQYLSNYYQQQQLYAAQQQQQQQQTPAQTSQVGSSVVASSQHQASVAASSQPSSSSAAAAAAQHSSGSSGSNVQSQAQQQRSNWSVSDTQSAINSSKLVPIQSASAAAVAPSSASSSASSASANSILPGSNSAASSVSIESIGQN